MKKRTILIGATVFVLDRCGKLWAKAALPEQGPFVALPKLLELRYSENRGIALGFLSGETAATLLLPILAVIVWFYVFRKRQAAVLTVTASAVMLAGFAGNILDRLMYGYVVDMLYFPFLPWFICNIADIAICVGVGMMGLNLLIRPQE